MSLCHNEGILLLLDALDLDCLFASLIIPWFEYLLDSLCLCTLPRQIWRQWDVRFCPPPSSPLPSRTTSLPLVVKRLLSALAEAREEAAGASRASRALLAALVLVLGLGLVTLGLVLVQLGLLLVLGLELVQILVLVQGLVQVPRLEPSSVRPR